MTPLLDGRLDQVRRKATDAIDAGASGRDAVYGQGVVGLSLRTPPAAVGARGRLAS